MSLHHKKQGDGTAAASAKSGTNYISLMALVMMNVTIIGSVANDVQQAYYGLSSITFFIIGAIVFFLPTGLVAAELASGWGQRGGIFRWVGEAMGPGFAFACLLVLWFQTSINFGSGVASAATTIGFFTPNWDWAVNFMNHPQNQLLIMIAWLAYYWLLTWISTKGVKAFAGLTKYGVLIGTFIPLAFMIVMCVVYLATGHPNQMVASHTDSFIPQWQGLSTLSLAAGVFFSFAGIDMNAAHIKQLKNPQKQFPASIFIAMILTLIIFIAGTLVIAIVTPVSQMNLVYGLNQTYKILGELFNCPWIYMVFVWAGLATSMASLITNMAGPSFMLGQAARSGFLPKQLQSNNKHGMPSRLMYTQMAFMTLIAFLVFLIPNIEGFVVLITQSITILYMLYYVLMFVSFLKLRSDQPNRPRLFKVPGGKAGAWIVAVLGLASCVFGIVLAIIPPAQVSAEVGSPVTYVVVILALIALVLAICFFMYRASLKHGYKSEAETGWVDPSNQFAPFTWQVEGLKKPARVLSNVPSEMLAAGQNPMGMPIKKLWDPNEQIPLPPEHTPGTHRPMNDAVAAGDDPAAMNHPVKTNGVGIGSSVLSQPPAISEAAGIGTAAVAGLPKGVKPTPALYTQPVELAPDVPAAPAAMVASEKIPADPAADAVAAQKQLKDIQAQEQAARAHLKDLSIQDQALKDQISADDALATAEKNVQAAMAAAQQAAKGQSDGVTPTAPADADPAQASSADANASKGVDQGK